MATRHLHRIICHYCRSLFSSSNSIPDLPLGLTVSWSSAQSSLGGHAALDNSPSGLCGSFL